jgi:hypothetical protein
VSGPHVIPDYIPPDVDMTAVMSAIGADGVSAPSADVAPLKEVVADARKDGIDLKIVVIPTSPPIDTPLRDIATEVGHAYPDSTVLVISPFFAGTYSRPPVFCRSARGARPRTTCRTSPRNSANSPSR